MPLELQFVSHVELLAIDRHWSRHIPDGTALEAEWNAKFSEYEKKYKKEAAELKSIMNGEFPAGWEKALPVSGFPFAYFPR